MGRPKIKDIDKKGRLGISISKVILKKLNESTNNKSKFIEDLLLSHFTK